MEVDQSNSPALPSLKEAVCCRRERFPHATAFESFSWDEHSVRAYLNKYAEYVCHKAKSRHETDWAHEDEQLREQLKEAKLTLSAAGFKSSLKAPEATERVLQKTLIQDLQLQRLNLRKQYRKAVAKTRILLYCDWKGARDR